jgi:hypothetical protein
MERAETRQVEASEMSAMHEHDGYTPHSHEVRADHGGVTRSAQPEPATAPLITWHEGAYTGFRGTVGTVRQALFGISWHTIREDADWVLTSSLPGMHTARASDNDRAALYTLAEEWLAEWVASIGAQFPG